MYVCMFRRDLRVGVFWCVRGVGVVFGIVMRVFIFSVYRGLFTRLFRDFEVEKTRFSWKHAYTHYKKFSVGSVTTKIGAEGYMHLG